MTETERCGGGLIPETGLWVRREGSLGHHETGRGGRACAETTSPGMGIKREKTREWCVCDHEGVPLKCQLPANSRRAVKDKDPYKPPARFMTKHNSPMERPLQCGGVHNAAGIVRRVVFR